MERVGNSFVLMMRALPQVVQIGETTGDGVGGPTFRELGNGWVCAVPDKLTTRPNGQPVDGAGLAPHLRVRNDAASGDDRILEMALALADKL